MGSRNVTFRSLTKLCTQSNKCGSRSDNVILPSIYKSWVVLDIPGLVDQQNKSSSFGVGGNDEPHSLEVRLRGPYRGRTIGEFCSSSRREAKETRLVILSNFDRRTSLTDLLRLKRRRRDLTPQVSDDAVCRLRPLTISFADIGWENMVLQPRQFTANYCSGSCPHPLRDPVLNASNHAIMLSIYKARIGHHNTQHIPSARCVPVRARPLTYIHNNREGIIAVRKLYDMTATACGCL